MNFDGRVGSVESVESKGLVYEASIVCEGDEEGFRDRCRNVFKDKEIIIGKLRELEPLRNAIGHSRKLSQRAKQKLSLHSADIMEMMKNMETYIGRNGVGSQI